MQLDTPSQLHCSKAPGIKTFINKYDYHTLLPMLRVIMKEHKTEKAHELWLGGYQNQKKRTNNIGMVPHNDENK